MSNVIRDLAGGELRQYKYPVSGAGTAIVRGAILQRVVADGGIAEPVAANSAMTDIYGLLDEDHAVAGDSVVGGTVWTLRRLIVNPKAVYESEYSQATADTFSPTNSVGTTVNSGAAEANFQGGWLFVAAGTGVGQLRYVTASVLNTSYTTKTAFSPALDGTSKLVKILPVGHKLCRVTSAGQKLASADAAGSGVCQTLQNRVRSVGVSDHPLEPTKDNELLIPVADLPVFLAELTFPNHIAG